MCSSVVFVGAECALFCKTGGLGDASMGNKRKRCRHGKGKGD